MISNQGGKKWGGTNKNGKNDIKKIYILRKKRKEKKKFLG